MKAGVRQANSGGGWEGIVKTDSGTLIWSCGHVHHNRDINGRRGRSARKCAELYVEDPTNWHTNIRKPI